MVPEPIIKALIDQGFDQPTPIQRLSIPAAIRDKFDILGAAPTGSGKTLAFGIPIIERILCNRTANPAKGKELQGLIITPTRELAIQIKKHLDNILTYVKGISVGCLVGGLAIPKQERILNKFKPNIVVATPGRLWEIIESGKQSHITRESIADLDFLVIDEVDRMTEKGHFEEMINVIDMFKAGEPCQQNYKSVPLTEKMEEEIVVNGIVHSSSEIEDIEDDFDYAQFEVIEDEKETDEVEEPEKNLTMPKKKIRQILVFSATLTFVHDGPSRIKIGSRKGGSKVNLKSKLSNLIELFGMREDKVKVIDLTEKERTGRPDVELLRETCITCHKDEKDLYLYYFLFEFPGRSIIFCNSVDCLRRLVSVLKLLNLDPISIHSGHDQKRRLMALEKFASVPGKGLLVASDVAARGLDMTDVDHVIHFQVPRTVETYVHRSGRTARASKKGVSVLLVEPKDAVNYRKLCSTLNEGSHFELLPIKEDLLRNLHSRVKLAREIDVLEHSLSKVRVKSDWFRKAAKEMDIDIGDRDDLFDERHDTDNADKQRKKLKVLKHKLVSCLKQPIAARRDRLIRSKLGSASKSGMLHSLNLLNEKFSSTQSYDEIYCHPCTLRIDFRHPMRRLEAFYI